MGSQVWLSANTASVDDNTKQDESNDGENFDDREDEFGFTIASYSEEVDKDYHNVEYDDPSSRINVLSSFPITDCDRSGSQF